METLRELVTTASSQHKCEEAYEIENSDKFETVVESIRGGLKDPFEKQVHANESADDKQAREKREREFFKQITITFNPWSERHWLKPMFFDPETCKPDTFATTTTFRCNEWLDNQDKQRYLDLYRTNPRRAKIVADGDWGVAEGLVFENFVVEDFDVNKVVADSDGVGHGMDFGFTHDPTTFAEAAINRKTKDIYIFNELYQKAMKTDDIFDWLSDNNYLKSDVAADSAEPRLIKELQVKGVRRIHGSIKGKDSIEYGINFLQGYRIHILPTCVHAIEEFNTYCFQQDKDGNWLNKPVDANNHFIDALRYALEKYILKYKSLAQRF
ncbi:PBSX family phage terminase large subunit [Lactiplantibacillus xiangfangensis]|uniref:PBSX family phage terminase large subunit n=1 Tax=Lactiplantibacillus xiangfangensis TaxID=942150 RepID=UPI00384F6FAA